jgi:DNA polymerase
VLPTLDFETYSEAGYYQSADGRWHGVTKTDPGLGAVGAPVYSEHPSTLILSLAYDLKTGAGPQLWTPDCPPPVDLFQHILSGGLLEAWNSAFEYYIWLNVAHRRMGWPDLPYWQLRDAMAKSRAHSLPGKLEKAAEVLQAVEQKDVAGKALLRKLSVPQQPTAKRPGGRCVDPAALTQLYAYNVQDIKAEAAVSELCPDLSAYETDVWLLDQSINFRGVHIDQAALADCISIIRQAEAKYTAELRTITHDTVQTAGELAKITGWLGANGCHTRSLDADAVEELLNGTDNWLLPENCRRVLEIRSMLGAAAVKKLFAIERRLSADGRLRDLFSYCGADRTGRASGKGPQPQNFPGGKPWEEVIKILAIIASRDLAAVESRYGDPVQAVSDCLRGLFAAAPGCDLICSDFSAIEAVVLAELAGEEWRQEVFRTHGKIYEASAATITGIPFEEFMRYKQETGQHHPMRKKVGKVAELASGYQGAVGAWKAFGADEFMTDDEILENVKAWRRASPQIVKFWYGVQDAAHMAVRYPGRCYSYQGQATKHGQPPAITYGVKDDILYCCLPSGRNLTYHTPRLEPSVTYSGKPTMQLTYMGWNSNYLNGPVGWMRLATHGGKLCENLDQAIARDILMNSMLAVSRAGYPIVLHVHDEIVSEVRHGWGSVEEFEQIMSQMPAWAAGWPVKAAGGWRGRRYRKD